MYVMKLSLCLLSSHLGASWASAPSSSSSGPAAQWRWPRCPPTRRKLWPSSSSLHPLRSCPRWHWVPLPKVQWYLCRGTVTLGLWCKQALHHLTICWTGINTWFPLCQVDVQCMFISTTAAGWKWNSGWSSEVIVTAYCRAPESCMSWRCLLNMCLCATGLW